MSVAESLIRKKKMPWTREQWMQVIMIIIAVMQGSGLFTMWKERIIDHQEIAEHSRQIEKMQNNLEELKKMKVEDSKTLAVVAERVEGISKQMNQLSEARK